MVVIAAVALFSHHISEADRLSYRHDEADVGHISSDVNPKLTSMAEKVKPPLHTTLHTPQSAATTSGSFTSNGSVNGRESHSQT